MLETLLRTTEKFIPKKLYKAGQPVYHWLLALAGALIYRFPSKEIKVVGITGTKGKTTTSELVASILETDGNKVALANGIHFKIGDQETRNMFKMSTPGRFFLQKFLRNAVTEGCDWVVLEITSEAAKQFRHKWIYLDAFIFTNLSPEHIESHGSFEKYKAAKIAITETLGSQVKKETHLIANADDEHGEEFLAQPATHKHPYSLDRIRPLKLEDGVSFRLGDSTVYSKLHGAFNAYNMLAAITFAEAVGIEEKVIKQGIESLEKVPGRAEKIIDDTFSVYVDYAHTPESLEALYSSFPQQKKICVLGNTGGGRDTWKRPAMAKIAEHYCDYIILTDEDPYDEDPKEIVNVMRNAISDSKKPVDVIMDRKLAIDTALQKAKRNWVVLITGKGTDPYIMRAHGVKEPWSDADVVRERFAKRIEKKSS